MFALREAIYQVRFARFVTSSWSSEQIAYRRKMSIEELAAIEFGKSAFRLYYTPAGGAIGAGLGAFLGWLYDKQGPAMWRGAAIGGLSVFTFLNLLTYLQSDYYKDHVKIILLCEAIFDIDKKLNSAEQSDKKYIGGFSHSNG